MHERALRPEKVEKSLAITLGGENLAEGASPEGVLYLLRDILLAACSLYRGESKAVIHPMDRPCELVLHRDGPDALITYYRLGRVPDVVLCRVPMPLKSLLSSMLETAGKVSLPDPQDVVLLKEIRSAVRAGKRLLEKPPHAAPGQDQGKPVETAWADGPAGTLGFGFQMSPTGHDLLAPVRSGSSDLSSLLFEGRLAVWSQGKHVSFGPGLLMLEVERLLSALRRVLGAWEQRRTLNARLLGDRLAVGVRLDKNDRIFLSLEDRGAEERQILFNHLRLPELAGAILRLSSDMGAGVLEAAPHQARNARFERFVEDRQELADWYRDLRRKTKINRNAAAYRLEAEREESGKRLRRGERAVRKLAFTQLWNAEIDGLDLDSVFIAGRHVLFTARGCLVALGLSDGSIAWRNSIDSVPGRTTFVGSDAVMRSRADGRVELLSLADGGRRWSVKVLPRVGGAPAGVVGGPPGTAPVIVLAEGERRLVALDFRNGEVRWKRNVRRGDRFTLRRIGRLVFMTCDDNSIYAIDVEHGGLVWRFSDRGRFLFPPVFHQGSLIAVSGHPGQAGGQLFKLDAFTGEPRWRLELGLGPVAPPVITGDMAVLELGREEKCELWGITFDKGGVRWRRGFEAGAVAHATLGLDNAFVVNRALGPVTCYSAIDGKEIWVTPFGEVGPGNVPRKLGMWLRGGALFVPMDTVYVLNPADGKVIASFGDDAPVPDALRITPEFEVLICEFSGYAAAYKAARSMWVVE